VTARDFTPGGEEEAEFFELPLRRILRAVVVLWSSQFTTNSLKKSSHTCIIPLRPGSSIKTFWSPPRAASRSS
jgi:hypothetical protein